MGRRIRVQRKGRGGINIRAPEKGKVGEAGYPAQAPGVTLSAMVKNLSHDRGRSAPLAQITLENGTSFYVPAVKGLTVGQSIMLGDQADPVGGNVLPLAKIPEGSTICNIENRWNDGGKLIRSSGTMAILFAQTPAGAVVRLPSGKSVVLDGRCRATVGEIAGGGRIEKPFLKAGKRWLHMKAKGKPYVRVRGIAMAAVFHPQGGSYKHKKGTSVARTAPPGAKVGHIAPRKSGRSRVKRP